MTSCCRTLQSEVCPAASCHILYRVVPKCHISAVGFFSPTKSKQVLDHLENYDVITYLTGFRGRKSMSMICMGVKGLEEEQEFKQFPRKIILITSYLRIRTDLVSKGRIGCALSLSTVLLIFWEMIYLNRRLAKPEIHQRNKQSPGNYCTSIKLCVIYSSVVQKYILFPPDLKLIVSLPAQVFMTFWIGIE